MSLEHDRDNIQHLPKLQRANPWIGGEQGMERFVEVVA
jgi:hypothetical protein